MATDAAVRPAGAALCACHGCCAAWAPSGRVVGACSSRSEIVDFPTRTLQLYCFHPLCTGSGQE